MRIIFLLLINIIVGALSIAQIDEDITFDDGKVIHVKTLSVDPDRIDKHSLHVDAATMGDGSFHVLGYSFYLPTKFFTKVRFGFSNIHLEANYYFLNQIGEKKLKQSIRNEMTGGNMIKKYAVEFKIPKRRSVGIHGGFNYSFSGLLGEGWNLGPSLFFGLGYLNSFQLELSTNQARKHYRGARFGRLNADVIYYLNDIYFDPEYSNQPIRKFTTRIYLDGRLNSWKPRTQNRNFFNYVLGVGLHPNPDYYINYIIGVGWTHTWP